MRQAIIAGISLADAVNVDKKCLMASLWHVAMTSLLEFADPDLSIAFLEDKVATIRGYGINGDSPIQNIAPEEKHKRAEEILKAVEIIYSQMAPAMDIVDESGRDGLTALFIATLGVLKEWWGPIHLRRIAIEQIKALRSGQYAPILPKEPLLPNKNKATLAELHPSPKRAARLTTMIVLMGETSNRWAITAEITEMGSHRMEQRTISGISASKDECLTNLATSLIEVITSNGSIHPEDRIRIVTDLPDSPPLGIQQDQPISLRLSGLLRERNTSWSGVTPESRKLIERTKKAMDDKA